MKELLMVGGLAVVCILSSCSPKGDPSRRTFRDDVDFLKQHVQVHVLAGDSGKALVAVVPEYQGRVMTSTSGGLEGDSYGWLNRTVIQSREKQPHINVFGGEDRFWLGPEGGQFSIFFEPGAPFDLEHWQTPEPIDWGGWETVSVEDAVAAFRTSMVLTNYSGTVLSLDAERTIRLIQRSSLAEHLGQPISPALEAVAFESDNRITNRGGESWNEAAGLLSIWILGMFPPSESTTVVIPFRQGAPEELGPIVNDAYFGEISPDRLVVEDAVLFFRGDGRSRGKIGIGPRRALPVLGSYDPSLEVLTLVQYSLPEEPRPYVNSMWQIQEEPFSGDVVNSYNDGPPSPGAPPLGPFYELETSSPAAALAPGQMLRHVHRTIHLKGKESDLDSVARATLGVSLEKVRSVFGN